MHLATAPRRRRTGRARLLPLGALLALPLLVTGLPGSSPTAQAAAGDRTTAQWNMHGQFQGSEGEPGAAESRWQNAVPEWLRHADVLALQEAGSAPPDRAVWNEHRFVGRGVTEHTLQLGGFDHPDLVNIYWGDVGQQRNGLAIVTRETATDVVQLAVHHDTLESRPIIGVQLGNDWYFTGHARALGQNRENDAAAMYEAARQEMRRRGVPDQNWHFLADFNTHPSRMPAGLQDRIVAVGEPTHQGGGELDFTMEGAATNQTARAQRQWLNSDHYGLLMDYQGCRKRDLACEAPLPGHTYRFFADYSVGMALTRARTLVGEPELRQYRPGRDSGDPDFLVQLRYSTQPGEYLLAYGGDGNACIERAGNDAVVGACDPDNEEQHWKLDGSRQIQDPDHTVYLQPGGAGLIVRGYQYPWRARPLSYEPPHDLRKRDDEAQPEQPEQPDPGRADDADAELETDEETSTDVGESNG